MVPESVVVECLMHAQSLQALTLNWLKNNKQELL